MVAQVSHRAPSGRFIRGYLLTWGLLAAGGLVYLASLAWHPDLFTPSQQTTQPDPSLQAANKALAEIGTVRRTVTEIQSDLGRLKEHHRPARRRGAAPRRRASAALEERVTTMATASAEPVAVGRQGAHDRDRQGRSRPAQGRPRRPPRTARIITIAETTPKAPLTPPPSRKSRRPQPSLPQLDAPKIETGSIGAARPSRSASPR